MEQGFGTLPIRSAIPRIAVTGMYDVRDVTNVTLEFADERGLKLTNLALQKLLYFVHGWFYSIYEQPLIKNKFEAWKYGPVQRAIYDQFKTFRDGAIRGVRATYIDPETGENRWRQRDLLQQAEDGDPPLSTC